MSNDYVHGYTERESLRLEDQANCLSELIHHDTIFSDGSLILEAGCGVGAQTRIVGQKNPGSKLISIDLSDESLRKAKALIRESRTQGRCQILHYRIFSTNFYREFFCQCK